MDAPPTATSTRRVAAIIPVLNEAGAIGSTIAQIPRDLVDSVIVVDGGSTDDTVAQADTAGAQVIVEARSGYGRACAIGAERALEAGAGILLFMDGDGSDAADLSARLIEPIEAGLADFCIASRTRGAREAGSLQAHQILAGHLIGRAVGLICGVRYTDMCAFRAIRADALTALAMREMTYGWNLEMQMRAALAGLRIQEIAMPYRRRIAGRSKVAGNLLGTIKASSRIIATLLRVSLQARSESGAAR